MEELLEEIQAIQKYLYGGYKNEGTSNMDWLEVRKLLFIIFYDLFKYISNIFSNSRQSL